MAGRGHVDVNERRLRPVYDALDNGNNKKAIQEADKILRKQKNQHCAKVLKSLALLRLGRHDECSANMEEVHNAHPADEGTLQAMTICYRESHQLEKIAEMYENATKERCDSEELLTALFMAYVRLCDYKQQQMTAMKLHRLKPNKNPYYFWAVMSIVMQAHESSPELAKQMFLPLAERMTKKYIDEEKIEAEAEVQMYIIVLEQLGKQDEALKIMQGPMGAKITSDPMYQSWKIAELLGELKWYPQMNAKYKKLLIETPDQWNFYLHYLKSLFALIDEGYNPPEDGLNLSEGPVDYTVAMAKEFLQNQPDSSSEGHKWRGPKLALLEFVYQLKERQSSEQDCVGEPIDLLTSYFDDFGSKAICFYDLQKYVINLLGEAEQKKWLDDLLKKQNLKKEDGSLVFVSDVKSLQRHLTLLQLSRGLGHHQQMSCEERSNLSREMVLRHKEALHFGHDLLSTEPKPADPYALMAALLLMDNWDIKGENRILWQIVIILEKAIRESPSAFALKLLLIKVYALLGALGPCRKLFESLEIKHIQFDSLGYVISSHMGRLGHYQTTCAVYEAMLKFFTNDLRETAEHLVASYKSGSFTKIHEFIKFRSRLKNSLQYTSATIERMLLDLTIETSRHQVSESLVHHMEIDPMTDRTTWEDLSDNRDFTAMPCWEPASKHLTEALQQQSLKEEIAWLRLRSLTLRLLSASVEVGKGGVKRQNDEAMGNGEVGAIRTSSDILVSLTEEYENQAEDCRKVYTKPFKYPINGPSRTRIATFLASNLDQVFSLALRTLFYVHTLTDEGLDNTEPEAEDRMSKLSSLLDELVTKHTSTLVSGDTRKKVLEPDLVENVVLVAETISYVVVVLGAGHKLLAPHKRKRNKKKKQQEPPQLLSIFESFNALVTSMEESTKRLHLAVKEIDVAFLSSEFGQLKLFEDASQNMEKDEKIEESVTENVRQSYQKSAKELLDFLNYKIAYLSTLIL